MKFITILRIESIEILFFTHFRVLFHVRACVCIRENRAGRRYIRKDFFINIQKYKSR